MKKLGIVLFVLVVLFFSACKKNLPTQPDIPNAKKPEIKFFTADPKEITLGQSSKLSWEVANATKVEIDQGIGVVSAKGSMEVSPTVTVIYTLSATNSNGRVTRTEQITFVPGSGVPIIKFITATPSVIGPGEKSVLDWEVDIPATVTIDQGIGQVALRGPMSVSPAQTTLYTITAVNDKGSATPKAVEVKVVIPLPKILFFTVTPDRLKVGETFTFSWKTENSDEVLIKKNTGEIVADNLPLEGSMPAIPLETSTYFLVASNSGGETLSAPETVKVFVAPVVTGQPKYRLVGTNIFECVLVVKNINDESIYNVKLEVVIRDKNGIELGRQQARWGGWGYGQEHNLKGEMIVGEEVKWVAWYVDEKQYLWYNHDSSKTIFNFTWSLL